MSVSLSIVQPARAGRTTVKRDVKALQLAALPGFELREQRCFRLRRHVALAERAREPDRFAELLEVARAVRAAGNVRFEACAVAAREGALEIVRHELDELAAGELFPFPQHDHRSSPRYSSRAARTFERARCKSTR